MKETKKLQAASDTATGPVALLLGKQGRTYATLAVIVLAAALFASYVGNPGDEYPVRFVGALIGGLAFTWTYRLMK